MKVAVSGLVREEHHRLVIMVSTPKALESVAKAAIRVPSKFGTAVILKIWMTVLSLVRVTLRWRFDVCVNLHEPVLKTN